MYLKHAEREMKSAESPVGCAVPAHPRPRRERAAPAAAAVVEQRARGAERTSQQSVGLEAALLVWIILRRTDFFTGIFCNMAG